MGGTDRGQRGFLVLLPVGGMLVHQLRYSLGYGPHASAALAEQGHAYLHSLAPWTVLLLAGALGRFVVRLARATDTSGHRRTRAIWGMTSAALLGLYVVQETLEGLLAGGHPAGFAAVFGHGGWWAVPAAAAIGLAIALLLRLADTAVSLAAGRRGRARRRPDAGTVFSSLLLPEPAAPLARAAAGRAPPVA